MLTGCLLLISCSQDVPGGSSSVDASGDELKRGTFEDRVTGGFSTQQDPETGEVRQVSDRENPFANASEMYGGEKSTYNQQYDAGEYDKRRWSGTKTTDRKSYGAGQKEYEYSPEFIKRNSQFATAGAREGSGAYDADAYTTGVAREASGVRQDITRNYQVEKRREVFVQPQVTPHDQTKTSGRTVEDVKSLLND